MDESGLRWMLLMICKFPCVWSALFADGVSITKVRSSQKEKKTKTKKRGAEMLLPSPPAARRAVPPAPACGSMGRPCRPAPAEHLPSLSDVAWHLPASTASFLGPTFNHSANSHHSNHDLATNTCHSHSSYHSGTRLNTYSRLHRHRKSPFLFRVVCCPPILHDR